MAAHQHISAAALGQGAPHPEREDAPALAGDRGVKGQRSRDGAHSAAVADDRKRLDTLRAALALRGHELHQLASGEFLVRRWGLSRELADLDAVADFARQVGATS